MATQYVMPPSYRAGRPDPKLGAIRDVLAFMEFVSRQQQEENQTKVEDAIWYNRQMEDERKEIRSEERAEKRRREAEELRFRDNGYIDKELKLRAKYTQEGDQLKHNMGLEALYDAGDLTMNTEGYYTVNAGALSKQNKAVAVASMQAITGTETLYNSEEYRALEQAMALGRTTMGPETHGMMRESGRTGKVVKETGELYDVDTEMEIGDIAGGQTDPWRASNIDPSPGVFSGKRDIEELLAGLSETIQERGVEVPAQAQKAAFMAGLTEGKGNVHYMDEAEYQTYTQGKGKYDREVVAHNLGVEKVKEGILSSSDTRLRSSDEQTFLLQQRAKVGQENVFAQVGNNIIVTEDNVTKISDAAEAKKDEIAKENPLLADASKFLFSMGYNAFESGGPKVFVSADEFFGKFIFLDKKARGGAPSIAERIMKEFDMESSYREIKSVVDGTHPSQRQGKFGEDKETYTPVYNYSMSISQQVAEYYGSIRPPADDPGRDWKRLDPSWEKFKFSAPFMEMMDASERQGKLQYGYEIDRYGEHIPILKFETKDEMQQFLLGIKDTNEWETFHKHWLSPSLGGTGLIKMKIKKPGTDIYE